MEKTIKKLNDASKAYYAGNPIMSDYEWDQLFNELKKKEEESGIILPDSPTQKAGAVVVNSLIKRKHEHPALSLDKVKYENREDLKKWLGEKNGLISWKCDGSTVVVTFDDGKMTSAVTRGNGEEGSDITHNAKFFKGIPAKIPFKGHLVVRGEAMMEYEEFKRINAEEGGIYENPRNLATATIQMLDANESRKREICFKAFELVTPEPMAKIVDVNGESGLSFNLTFMADRMNWLESMGFTIVEHEMINAENLLEKIEEWKSELPSLNFPTDGLVISYNDMIFGMSLGNTGHHFRHSIALKWTDETKKTVLRDIEWSVGKTGFVTPVAIFDPVRLGAGSTITRASLHNISCLRNVPLENDKEKCDMETLSLNDSVNIYLANMIIPKVASYGHNGDYSEEHRRTSIEIPKTCPVCGGKLETRENNGIITLHCVNENCAARQIGNLMNTFSKDGLFVKGLGESQIEDLMQAGLVDADPLSFYKLTTAFSNGKEYSDKVVALLEKDGWGKKKWSNLIDAINVSRDTTLQKFLYSLNIPLLGKDLSKKLTKFWHNDVNHFRCFIDEVIEKGADGIVLGMDELMKIDGIGEEKARNVAEWCYKLGQIPGDYEKFLDFISELNFPEPVETSSDSSLEGLTFVITGAVHEYKNRDEFKESVEKRGGKVAGSVSAKTSFLVNNDVKSASGKNKKAKELNIPIISETEFIEKFGK